MRVVSPSATPTAPARQLRGTDVGLGRRRDRLAARSGCSRRRAGVEVDRVGPDPRRARPDAAGPPRGVRARRHGRRSRRSRRLRSACRASRRSRCSRGATSARAIRSGTRRPFRYHDKGNLATIGRSRAVADIKGIRAERLPGLGDLARRAPHVPDRLREPPARAGPLGVLVRDAQPRRPADPPGEL